MGTIGYKAGKNYTAWYRSYLLTPKVFDPAYKKTGYTYTNENSGQNYGFAGETDNWQFRLTSQQLEPSEIFADMFVGWVYDTWDTNNDVIVDVAKERRDFMDENMPIFIQSVILTRIGNAE